MTEKTVSRSALGLSIPYREPTTDLERTICRIFSSVFGVDQTGCDDDFFDMGGDSVTAETLAVALASETGADFQIASLLQSGTPALIAELLKRSEALDRAADSPKPGIPPLFAVHGRLGFSLPKREFTECLPEGQALRLFELPGIRDRSREPLEKVEEIAAAYVSEINETYPRGPILLSAFCMGALIAMEMARQLTDQGRNILRLVLLDPSMPGTTAELMKLEGEKTGRRWQDIRSKTDYVRWRASRTPIPNERIRRLWELYFRFNLWRTSRRKTDGKWGLGLNRDAQAKLLAAYHNYLPTPYAGPTIILLSSGRADHTRRWRPFFKNMEILHLTETHKEVVAAQTGKSALKLGEISRTALAEIHAL